MKKNVLLIVAIVLVSILIALTSYLIYYLVSNREKVETKLRNEFTEQIASIQLQQPINGIGEKVDYSIVRDIVEEEVAKLPRPKDGVTPVKEVDYFDGKDAEPITDEQLYTTVSNYFIKNPVPSGPIGPAGRYLEQRCNPLKLRIEQKYSDTETWEILYYLPLGAVCNVLQ